MGLSSNILWHQTNRAGIEAILKSKYLLFSYSRELVPGDDTSRAFPMISLCDLPFSEMSDYLGKYGDYTIGFDREWGVKNHFNPVWYCNDGSYAVRIIREQINKKRLYTAAYVKPVEGYLETDKYTYLNYRYYDEREVRIVLSEQTMTDNNEKWSLSKNEYDDYKKK